MTSARKYYVSKSFYKMETITCIKVSKYLLAFNQESELKLLDLISKDSLIKDNNVYKLDVKICTIHT